MPLSPRFLFSSHGEQTPLIPVHNVAGRSLHSCSGKRAELGQVPADQQSAIHPAVGKNKLNRTAMAAQYCSSSSSSSTLRAETPRPVVLPSHEGSFSGALILVPLFPLLILGANEIGAFSPRPQFLHRIVWCGGDDHSMRVFGNEATKHLRLLLGWLLALQGRPVPNLCVKEVTCANGQYDFGSRIAPSTLEIVATVAVVVQAYNGGHRS